MDDIVKQHERGRIENEEKEEKKGIKEEDVGLIVKSELRVIDLVRNSDKCSSSNRDIIRVESLVFR